MSSSTTTEDRRADDSVGDRRKRGIALTVGGMAMIVLVKTGLLPFYWVPLILGLTYLAAAAASGGRGSLWAPGLTLSIAGLAIGLWLNSGRSAYDLQFLGLTILGLGTGGVLAALMARAGYDITAMSVAMTIMAFGGIVLAVQLTAQEGITFLAGNVYLYGGLLIVWGLVGVVKGSSSSLSRHLKS